MNGKRLRGWLIPLMILILMAVSLSWAEPAAKTKKYTVMYYMCGADLERDHGSESASMGDILGTRYNTEEINVISLLGGTTKWAGNRFSPDVLSIVDISGRRPTKVDEMPLSPMSQPETLTSFLNYCQAHYPAEHYLLVISDHGGGPLLGCCVDYLFDKTLLSVNGLRQALADSVFADRGLDTIVFNCCLMGSLEIGNSIAPFAKYMVATEDSMYGMGQDWLIGLEKDETPLETAKKIARTTYERNKEAIERQQASQLNSVSVIDLEKVTEVIPAMDRYFASRPQVDEKSFTLVSGQRRDAVSFGVDESGGNSQYDLVDVGSLISRLGVETEEGNVLQQTLQEAIPVHFSDVENCAGLTVYHPYLNRNRAEKSMEVYASLGFASAYVDYVINYTSIMTGKPLATWANLLTGKPDAEKLNRTLFTLALNKEQEAHYGDAKMKVFWKGAEDTYSFTYVSTGTTMEDGKVTGEFTGLGLFAVDSEGKPLTEALNYSLAPNGSMLIPAELTLPGEDGAEAAVHQAMIYATADSKTQEVTPGGVLVWDDAMECWTTSFGTVFEDYSQAKLTCTYRKETADEQGTLLPFERWQEAGEQSWTLETDGSWQFRMLDVSAQAENLYASFEVQDSQGNLYASSLKALRSGLITPDVQTVEYDDKDTLKMDGFALTWRPEQRQLAITGNVVNLIDQEVLVVLDGIRINGQVFGQKAEIYGMGENWGLLKNEKQLFNILIPGDQLAGIDALSSLSFDLNVTSAVNPEETLAVISVQVTTLLPLEE